VLTLVARTSNEGATRRALAGLQAPLAKLFTTPSAGSVPVSGSRTVAGVTVNQLQLTPSLDLSYAVFDGKVVISTALSGITAARSAKHGLADQKAFKELLAGRPQKVSSLVFLDFSQLLRLGEQTGLRSNPAYLALRGSLAKVKAVGASSSPGKADSTAEITFLIS